MVQDVEHKYGSRVLCSLTYLASAEMVLWRDSAAPFGQVLGIH